MAKLALIILDGLGAAPRTQSNPRSRAATPVIDRLEAEAYALTLQASGIAVGLPWGEPGNSEVGHLSIGSGRIVYHHLPRIIASIQDGSFFENPALVGAFSHAKANGGRVHVMGLVSSGSVHAYVDHLYAIMELAQRRGQQLALHVFSDGRDAEPNEAKKFLPQIEERLRTLGVGRIVSIMGRDFAMDRDGHWDRTEAAYRLITQGIGQRAVTIEEAIAVAYGQGHTDANIPPTAVLGEDAAPITLADGDALMFLNFREDSARQIAETFAAGTFTRFVRLELPKLKFVTLTQYLEGLHADVAFPPVLLSHTLGEVIADAGLSQLRVAETDKYAHVTYFFNGLREQPLLREDRVLIPSVSVQSEDMAPAMRAADLAEAIARDIEKGEHDVIIANFANADMVGHTGNFEACAKAFEALDTALERLISVCASQGVTLLITSDHGNIEEKIDLMSGRKLTEHTLNPVPFFALGPGVPARLGPFNPAPGEAQGLIIDIAPTILALLGIPMPAEMAGRNLFAPVEDAAQPTVQVG